MPVGKHDVHARAIASSLTSMATILEGLDPDNVVDELDDRIGTIVARVAGLVAGTPPIAVVELARLRALPWHSGRPEYHAGIENGFCLVELIAVIAMYAPATPEGAPTPPFAAIDECLLLVEELRDLGALRAVAVTDPDDPLSWISATLQISEMSMRGSSYAELLEETNWALFDNPEVDAALLQVVGFTASDAIRVLRELHELQIKNMNRRQSDSSRNYEMVERNYAAGIATEQERTNASRQLLRALQPDEASASASIADVARAAQRDPRVTEAVLDAFSWRPTVDGNAETTVRAFLRGENPLRATPIIRTGTGRALLVHPALTQAAIRERLETILRSTDNWESYQAERGRLLEHRTRDAFERLLPSHHAWHSFYYYVPSNESERSAGPDKYTKRVEGDHLVIAGDVAVLIEDKAVALSAPSRSASSFRLWKDLTSIITNAARQADRAVQRIRQDGGLRIHGDGWVDLRYIKEIHTVAVSLEDLTSTSTATADLIQAGLISEDSIPWTVSIHDLELIAEIAERPAEFLLYLRRRRHPMATVIYTAPDELDLYLYFLEAGLYVEEDPDALRSAYEFLPAPDDGELQRWRAQRPGVVTSRTDALDAWYFEDFIRVRRGRARMPTAPPKPRMLPSPLSELADAIENLQTPESASIIATLLSGDTRTQRRMARYPRDVCHTTNGSRERTISVPIATLDDGGWLFVWGACPSHFERETWEGAMRTYLRAKGHQIGVSRAAMFAFDGSAEDLWGVFYESIPQQLTPSELAVVAELQPMTQTPSKTTHGQRPQPRRRPRRKR